MILRLITLLLITATIYGYPYGAEMLATTIAFYGFMYYYILVNVVCGLKSMIMNWDDRQSMHDTTIAVLSNALAITTLIMVTPYAYIGYIALPWIGIMLSATLFGWLIHLEILEITDKDDE
jgi:hypothetical protein